MTEPKRWTAYDQLREAVAALPQYVITIQDREGYTYERGCAGQPMNYKGVMLADVEALVGRELKYDAPVVHVPALRVPGVEAVTTLRDAVADAITDCENRYDGKMDLHYERADAVLRVVGERLLSDEAVEAAATPDPPKPPPPPLVDGSPYPIPASAVPAASPDERLREADRRVILEWAKFTRDEAAGYWGRREEDVYQRLLAAADREKPDEDQT